MTKNRPRVQNTIWYIDPGVDFSEGQNTIWHRHDITEILLKVALSTKRLLYSTDESLKITNLMEILILVFGLTQPGLKSLIYHIWGEHANQYTTNAVVYADDINWKASKLCVQK